MSNDESDDDEMPGLLNADGTMYNDESDDDEMPGLLNADGTMYNDKSDEMPGLLNADNKNVVKYTHCVLFANCSSNVFSLIFPFVISACRRKHMALVLVRWNVNLL